MLQERIVRVQTGKGYDVSIGAGLLQQCGERIRKQIGICKLAVVTDSTVANLYLRPVQQQLEAAGFSVCTFVFPAGESFKRMTTLADMLEFLAEKELTRTDAIVALGGGVTGDMAGFAAGCYLRGIRYLQMPTTLLAAVDSSVGGKTAVDLAAGKNLAGLFHQPELVICDTKCLTTLPPSVFSDGAAEAIKTGVLDGEALFQKFEQADPQQALPEIIARCVAYKGRIVESDPQENGMRKLLNLGHTIGHAIEKCSDYTLPHGHAVAVGMAMIARAAAAQGDCDPCCAKRIQQVLQQNGLPVSTTFSVSELTRAALTDKKRAGNEITLVIPQNIGTCILKKIPVTALESVIAAGMVEIA